MSTTTAKKRPARNADHVVIGESLRLTCLHCGVRTAAVDRSVGIEIGAMAKASKAFSKTHADCHAPASPRCPFCMELGHTAEEHAARLKSAEDWLASGDTGTSSRAICKHMMAVSAGRNLSGTHPWDLSDFGRCHRLLKLFPAWRARIAEMARYASWVGLAGAWDELEALYVEEITNESGMAPKLYARMRMLGGRL